MVSTPPARVVSTAVSSTVSTGRVRSAHGQHRRQHGQGVVLQLHHALVANVCTLTKKATTQDAMMKLTRTLPLTLTLP